MAFTGTSALTNQVQSAFDRVGRLALRAGAVYDQFVTVQPGNVTSPGSSTSFLFYSDLAVATTALSETVDTDAVALSDSLVTVTPAEHGNTVITTIKLQATTFDPTMIAKKGNIVAFNMLDSVETLAQEAIESGATTTTVDAGAEGSLTAGDVMTMNKLREQVAILRGANVMPLVGSNFAAILHPDVEYDLMTATASTDWSAFAIRQSSAVPEWKNGFVTDLAGLTFYSTPRAAINTDGGSGTVDTYSTYILGDESVGKVMPISPHIVVGNQTDHLNRFFPLSWYGYLAYSVIRSAAARNLIAASSIGTN